MFKKIKNDKVEKAERLAKMIYEAIIRYINSKKTEIGEKTHHYRLDFSRVWRGNSTSNIDPLEKQL